MFNHAKMQTLLGSLLVTASGSIYASTPVIDSNGFEAPDYTTGSLEGQNSWLAAGGGDGTATVQTSVVSSGSQAVQVNRAANSDDFWAVPVVGYPSLGIDQILITWDMYVTETTSSTFGPLFGIQAYDDNGGFGQLAGLMVDSKTRDVVYQAAGSGSITESGVLVDYNEWNTYSILIDFAADQYTISLNSSDILTEGFIDAGLDDFTDADIVALAGFGDPASLSATGTAYFDNYSVVEVPEPTSLALLGLGGLLLARRRR